MHWNMRRIKKAWRPWYGELGSWRTDRKPNYYEKGSWNVVIKGQKKLATAVRKWFPLSSGQRFRTLSALSEAVFGPEMHKNSFSLFETTNRRRPLVLFWPVEDQNAGWRYIEGQSYWNFSFLHSDLMTASFFLLTSRTLYRKILIAIQASFKDSTAMTKYSSRAIEIECHLLSC